MADSYLKNWRKCQSDMLALVESSSEDDENGVFNLDLQSENDQGQLANDSFGSGTDENGETIDEVMYAYTSDTDDDARDLDTVSSTTDANDEASFQMQLAAWATKHSCTRSCVNDLLGILRRQGYSLARDQRTLLQTPRSIVVTNKCGGQYTYFGLESRILSFVQKNSDLQCVKDGVIHLTINVDGLPLFKSTSSDLWPILCSINGQKPFVVALFYGTSKPNSVDNFLEDFLKEYERIQQNGVVFADRKFTVTIRAFVCDAPARAFLKCTINHNGYYSCERCTVKGSWSGRVVFNSDDEVDLRTDANFEQMLYTSHQSRKSPLVNIGVPCVKGFTLDYMHLVCLGVVRRFLNFLKKGPRECRLSQGQINQISESLLSLRGKLPSDFARQPRSLSELDRWKATELRQFLLYTGMLVLKGVLPSLQYEHFLTLVVAMRILVDGNTERRTKYLDYAKQLLIFFVGKCSEFYGSSFTVYNVHSLLHLHEDVQYFGCTLDPLSAFPFENYLCSLKKIVKNSNNPISQVAKRLAEKENNCLKTDSCEVNEISVKSERDRCFDYGEKHFAFVKEQRGNYVLCELIKKTELEDIFDLPCRSKLFHLCYYCPRQIVKRKQILVRLSALRSCKAAMLPFKQGFALIPLLHQL